MEIRLNEKALFEGEHQSRTLELFTEAEMSEYEVRLAFLTPAGRRFLTDAVPFSGESAAYPLPAFLLDAPGVLYAQMVAEDENLHIRKSDVFAFEVEKSIDAAASAEGGEVYSLKRIFSRIEELSSELGTFAKKTEVPTKVSDLFNDADYASKSYVDALGDYENLTHLPRINGVALLGDKSAEDLFLIGEISNEEILQIWNTVMN